MFRTVLCAFLASAALQASGAQFELRGKVAGADFTKYLHVQLFAVEAPFTAVAEVSKRGDFRFRDLDPGNYTLALVRAGLGEIRRTVVVTPGLADAQGVVRTEIAYSPSEMALTGSSTVSIAALSIADAAQAKYDEAQLRLSRRDVQGADAALRQAVSIAPEFALAWNALGVIAFQSGDVANAEAHFRSAVDAERDSFEASVNLGGLLLRTGRPEESLGLNRRAAEQRPDDALAQVQLGMTLFKLQRYEEAERPLAAAKRLDPANHMQPQLFLAEIYSRRGERVRATEELQELLALRPDHPQRAKLLATIAHLSR